MASPENFQAIFLARPENFQARKLSKQKTFQARKVSSKKTFKSFFWPGQKTFKHENFQAENFQAEILQAENFQAENFQAENFQAGQMGTYGRGGRVSLGRQRQTKINSVRFECSALKPNRIDFYYAIFSPCLPREPNLPYLSNLWWGG